MRRISEEKLSGLIAKCINEAFEEFTDNKGDKHTYDVLKNAAFRKDSQDKLQTIKACLIRGGWEFSDIIRTEDGELTVYAIPSQDMRVREFGMVAALISQQLGTKVKQGAYNPSSDEVSGVHFVTVPIY